MRFLIGMKFMLLFGVICAVFVSAMKKNSIPENLLATNPITESHIKIGGKTFNRLVNSGILNKDGTIKANSNVILAEKERLKQINNEHAKQRQELIQGTPNQRLDITTQDVKDADVTTDEALLLLAQTRKYINSHFNSEVEALIEAAGSQ